MNYCLGSSSCTRTTDAQRGNSLQIQSQSQIFRYSRSHIGPNFQISLIMPSLGVRSPCSCIKQAHRSYFQFLHTAQNCTTPAIRDYFYHLFLKKVFILLRYPFQSVNKYTYVQQSITEHRDWLKGSECSKFLSQETIVRKC